MTSLYLGFFADSSKTLLTSSFVVFFSTRAVISAIEPVIMGTLKAVPSNFPFN
jgi:hypothetical protein